MHQTTIRFSSDVWELLEREAGQLGVSAAQYIRESVLVRVMYTAGRRGDPQMGAAIQIASRQEPTALGRGQAAERRTEDAVEDALSALESSEALWAQGRLARERARLLREAAHHARGLTPHARSGT